MARVGVFLLEGGAVRTHERKLTWQSSVLGSRRARGTRFHRAATRPYRRHCMPPGAGAYARNRPALLELHAYLEMHLMNQQEILQVLQVAVELQKELQVRLGREKRRRSFLGRHLAEGGVGGWLLAAAAWSLGEKAISGEPLHLTL